MYSFAWFIFPLILFNKFYLFVDFCKKLILINKLIKYNYANDLYCDIKYLNICLFF